MTQMVYRKYYLVYYNTKVNNLMRYCVSKKSIAVLESGHAILEGSNKILKNTKASIETKNKCFFKIFIKFFLSLHMLTIYVLQLFKKSPKAWYEKRLLNIFKNFLIQIYFIRKPNSLWVCSLFHIHNTSKV